MSSDEGTVRVDSWIWSVRLMKTRSMASTACRAGHVRVNGNRVKPAHAVRPGDEVRLRHAGRERIVVVSRLISKRVAAPVAAECYVDNSPPPPPREERVLVAVRDPGMGRPSKRDRRELARLRELDRLHGVAPLHDLEAALRRPARDEDDGEDGGPRTG
ncbi:RNA-binding S4 domain-containing protein [Streptomyces sp. NPDC018031]|uniref:RNA-binding S4 domain-containing protein n=1 Tax=Streptomyces sp. NPDC018031 TaxID=3365033 RepID=UPI0037A0CA15